MKSPEPKNDLLELLLPLPRHPLKKSVINNVITVDKFLNTILKSLFYFMRFKHNTMYKNKLHGIFISRIGQIKENEVLIES